MLHLIIRSGFICCLVIPPFCTFCQDSVWTTIDINGDIKASLPGSIDTIKNFKNGPYTFDVYSGKRSFNLYMIQCSSASVDLNIYDSSSYEEALAGVQKGALDFYREQHMEPILGDTIIGGIHMKTISNQSLTLGKRLKRFGYVFILNDRAYVIYAIQGNFEDSDSSELHQFLSSIQFTSNRQEQKFATKKEALAYNFGRLIGGLLSIGVVVLVVFFVVRAIVRI